MKPVEAGLKPAQIESRFQGALMGLALGDALAFPFKGHSRTFLSTIPDILAHGFTRHPSGFHPAGQITDETQAARLTARAILERGGVCGDTLAELMIPAWRDGHVVDSGLECQEVLQTLIRGRTTAENSGLEAGAMASDALTRAVPVGLLRAGDPEALVRDLGPVIGLTHRDPVVLASASALGAAISFCVESREIFLGSFLDAISGAARSFHEGFADLIDDFPRLLSMTPYRALEQMARLLRALYIEVPRDWWGRLPPLAPLQGLVSLYLFLRSPFRPGRTLTSALHAGGEITTTCALCGALAGALLGNDAWPEELESSLESRVEIRKEASGLFQLWRSSGEVAGEADPGSREPEGAK